MNTFLICPVRGKDPEELMHIVKSLEAEGWNVHYPPRDTCQDDPTGFQICKDNVSAIKEADVIHIYYDPESRGSLFDLGVSFTLGKPIKILNTIDKTQGKSFANMILDWESSGLV